MAPKLTITTWSPITILTAMLANFGWIKGKLVGCSAKSVGIKFWNRQNVEKLLIGYCLIELSDT